MISVVMSTYSRENLLHAAVKSLLAQDFDRRQYEILIIDNAPNENRKALIRNINNGHPNHGIRYVEEPIPGLLSGRHRGVKESKGDILVFTDEDIEADTCFLSSIDKSFKNPDTHLVGGPCLPKYENVPPKWMKYMWFRSLDINHCGYLSLIDLGKKEIEIDPYLVWGLNLSIRKQTLFDLGGFNPDSYPRHLQKYQGDGDGGLTLKLRDKGLKAVYQPKALVYHYISSDRMTIEYFEQRMFYQGVCNSYTDIRRNGGRRTVKQGADQKNHPHNPVYRYMATLFCDPFLFLTKLKKKMRTIPFPRIEPSYVKTIKDRLLKAYNDGYSFHQAQVEKEPELLRWILKYDYFDYRIPE